MTQTILDTTKCTSSLVLQDRFPGTRALAHVALADLPTPVEALPELARHLGLGSLFVKRDDLSGQAYGGNKVRKLEFLLGQALVEKRRSIMTFGARGSNHVRATAVYGKQLGLRVHAILTPQPTTSYLEANLLADRAAGATLHFVESYREALDRGAELQTEITHHDGIAPFVIPFGGTSPRGTIGFVNAAFELAAQIERGDLPIPDMVYVPFGSMGTASGLALGFAALSLSIDMGTLEGFPNPPAMGSARQSLASPTQIPVIGVRVVSAQVASLALCRRVVREAMELLNEYDPGFPRLAPESVNIQVRDGFLGDGYAVPSSEAREAVDLAATHGLHLETSYTGKALAALVADARENRLTDKTVLFWNTYSSRAFTRG